MLVTGVDMGLSPHKDDTVEVMDVDMNEHPKKPTEYLLADLEEVLWEGNPFYCTYYLLSSELDQRWVNPYV